MTLKIYLLRTVRGLSYLFSYIFLEYPRGLDFSLRNKSSGISLLGNHGYALTSKKALKNMFTDIPLSGKSFIDIGSGKGGAVCYAYQLGCQRSAGIEYEEHLHNIAQKNIETLDLKPHCASYNIDARAFNSYENFDIYFMFNPFDDDIYEDVIDKIVSQNKSAANNKAKYLICYGGANIKAVVDIGYFELIKESECPYRGNLFRVFKTITKLP
jgi:16S rRNA G966 N2-methylase RsmD